MSFSLATLCLVITMGTLPGPAAGLSSDDFLADCATETYAPNDQAKKIRFTVWCGVRSDDVSFSLRRPKDERIVDFKAVLKAWGRGATSPFRCSRRYEAVRCVGQKEGPIKVHGWITVEDERCALGVNMALDGTIYFGKPIGCPGVQRFWRHWGLRYLQSERRRFGFDLDLEGDQDAISRRIRGLIRAWRQGEPVARGTADFLGMPMRAWEQREWEYRSEYVMQLPEALDPWVSQFAKDTYAGYYVDHEHGGMIYVGFVGDQEAQLASFLTSAAVRAPERLRPFPIPPRYSLAELYNLMSELSQMAGPLGEAGLDSMINRIGVDIETNVVQAFTEEVTAVRQIVDSRFGPDAPIAVIYGRPLRGNVKPKPVPKPKVKPSRPPGQR